SCLGTKLLLSLAAADGSGSSRRTWHQRWRRQIAQWMRLQENFDEQHSDEYEDCTDSESDVEADIATGSAVAKAVFKMRGCFSSWAMPRRPQNLNALGYDTLSASDGTTRI
ncbi:unnamed protein product, partial [Prorocentrum cordatum]